MAPAKKQTEIERAADAHGKESPDLEHAAAAQAESAETVNGKVVLICRRSIAGYNRGEMAGFYPERAAELLAQRATPWVPVPAGEVKSLARSGTARAAFLARIEAGDAPEPAPADAPEKDPNDEGPALPVQGKA